MYQIRTPGISRKDEAGRWALPDRVFFACGACHVLAHAFLERHGTAECEAIWLRPATGFIGNHIVVAWRDWIFDYHGYSAREVFLDHTWKRARQRWPGWTASLHTIPAEVLACEAKSRAIEGLRLREPGQFLHDPLPRAHGFLDRFPKPCSVTSAGAVLR